MIQSHEAAHSIRNLPYPTLITHILEVVKVPFKVEPKGHKDRRAIGYKTLYMMGLVDMTTGLTIRTSCVHTTSAHTSMMTLLQTLVRKVTKVLKT